MSFLRLKTANFSDLKGSSSKCFGRIANQMVRESWGFQLTWCVVWNPYDDDLLVNFGSALDRSDWDISSLVSLLLHSSKRRSKRPSPNPSNR